MGKKETLLSIGDFSKVTGVSIKALRYYDEAGILTPALWIPIRGTAITRSLKRRL